MIIRVVFRLHERRSPSDLRDTRFRQLVRVASQTPFYEPYILSGKGWTEAEIRDLPFVDYAEVRANPERFWNPGVAPRTRHELVYPFPRPARTAVMSPGFYENDSLYCFPNGWSPRLNEYEPEVLAGPLNRLRSVALAVLRKRIKMPPVRQAVLAFVGFDQRSVRPEDRELFWRAFGVPVFEQFLVQGETLASECEAHEGLHVFDDRGIYEFRDQAAGRELVVSCLRPLPYPVLRWTTGVLASLKETRCECGEHQARVIAASVATAPVRRLPENVLPIVGATPRVRAMAAAAAAAAGSAIAK